jgi:hypothetical protein
VLIAFARRSSASAAYPMVEPMSAWPSASCTALMSFVLRRSSVPQEWRKRADDRDLGAQGPGRETGVPASPARESKGDRIFTS